MAEKEMTERKTIDGILKQYYTSSDKLDHLYQTELINLTCSKNFDYEEFHNSGWLAKIVNLLSHYGNHLTVLKTAIANHLNIPEGDLFTEQAAKEKREVEYFVNREAELKELLNEPTSKNYIIQAPTGYGKTFLLRDKLRLELDKQEQEQKIKIGFYYFDAASEKLDTIDNFKKAVKQTFNVEEYDDVSAKLVDGNYSRIYLIFDHFERLIDIYGSENSQSTEEENSYRKIVKDFIEEIIENGKNSDFKLYVILSGRKVEFNGYHFKNSLDVKFNLSDFDEEVIKQAIQISVQKTSKSLRYQSIADNYRKRNKKEIYNDLFDFTGGHPRIVRELLIQCENKKYTNRAVDEIIKDKSKTSRRETMIGEIVEQINSSLYSKDQLKLLLRIISVFRIFCNDTFTELKKLLKNNNLKSEGDNKKNLIESEEEKLLRELLEKTYLFDKKYGTNAYLGDSITRQLFLYSLYNEDNKLFKKINDKALEIYKSWGTEEIKSSRRNLSVETIIFIREFIYHFILPLKLSRDDKTETHLEELRKKLKKIKAEIEKKNFPNDSFITMSDIREEDRHLYKMLTDVFGEDSAKIFEYKTNSTISK